jgi:cellulose synthase/poly-beta-1,6-N-acetylglucosamine synthase-like glycosyltransferase
VISALAVVIPARNEAATVGACLGSVQAALRQLPPDVTTSLCVVLDRCTDGTPQIVETILRASPRSGVVVNSGDGELGTIRHRGVLAARSHLSGHPTGNTWLLHTDADTTVPIGWARTHLRRARRGAHAVAGLADIDDMTHLRAEVRRRYLNILADNRGSRSHRHVYGANLGVRADAYDAIGGFAARSTGEDRDLIDRVRAAGYRVDHASDVPVSTSGRLAGRAPGGVAALLCELEQSSWNRRTTTPSVSAGARTTKYSR